MTVTSWQTFNAKMEEVKSAVLAWGEDIETSVNRGKSLIFVGKTGTGKTHLGTAIVMGALRKGFVAKIVDCSLLLSEIYETYGKDDAGRAKGEAAKLIRAYIDLDVLVIDEIGRSPISSHGADFSKSSTVATSSADQPLQSQICLSSARIFRMLHFEPFLEMPPSVVYLMVDSALRSTGKTTDGGPNDRSLFCSKGLWHVSGCVSQLRSLCWSGL